MAQGAAGRYSDALYMLPVDALDRGHKSTGQGRTVLCRALLTSSHQPEKRQQAPLGVWRPALLLPSWMWLPGSRPLLPNSSCAPASCSSRRPLRRRLPSPLLTALDPGSRLGQAALQTGRPLVLVAAGPGTPVSHLWLVPLLPSTRSQGIGRRGSLHRMRQRHLPSLPAHMPLGEQGDAP